MDVYSGYRTHHPLGVNVRQQSLAGRTKIPDEVAYFCAAGTAFEPFGNFAFFESLGAHLEKQKKP